MGLNRRMELKNVVFTGRDQAEASIGWPHWAVISITAEQPAALKEGWHSILRLEFDDIDVVGDFDTPKPYILFNDTHANRIIEFAEAVSESHKVEGILVHCQAGISRSAAVAKWISEKYQLPFAESYALYNKHVYRVLREEMLRRRLDESAQEEEGGK